MITIALKDWLATNAGISNCYSSTGIAYTDPDGIARTGSTGDVLNAFVVAHLVGLDSAVIKASTNYTQLKVINENNDLTIADVAFAYNNDGEPAGEPKYCIGACVPLWKCETPLNGYESDGCGNRQLNPVCNPVCIPSWQCEIPLNGYRFDGCGNRELSEACNPAAPGLAGTYEFIGPQTGAPTITLDLSALEMKQNSTDYHFEMNDIVITSTSPQNIYIALEVRLFSGALNLCPTSGSVFTGMDRVSTTRIPRIKLLDPGEVNNINADFYQPEAIRGVHTVCLLVHGAWTRQALEDEIALITG